MHRNTVTGADYEVYEPEDVAERRRRNDRARELATHAVYDAQRPNEVGDDYTREVNSEFGIPPTMHRTVPEKFRKTGPGSMTDAERQAMLDSPSLPHRRDLGYSRKSGDVGRRTGYYHTAVTGYLTDAYRDKKSPIDRKASSGKTYKTDSGITYVLPHGLDSSYRATTDGNGDVVAPHTNGTWGKSLTSRNKHLTAERKPTEVEALRNITEPSVKPGLCELQVPREFLVMLARFDAIQVQRGVIPDDGRGEVLRTVAENMPRGTVATIELYTRTEVERMTQNTPKRFTKGEFGEFLKTIAKRAKIAN